MLLFPNTFEFNLDDEPVELLLTLMNEKYRENNFVQFF